MNTTSIWNKTAAIKERAPLRKDMQVDTVIIGGGMAGILTAHILGQRGVKCIVLEAGRIASGQTGNTTAKVTSQHNLIYDNLMKKHGKAKARQYAYANQEAIKRYQILVDKYNIDCEWERCPAYLYTEHSPAKLWREYNAATSLGLPAAMVEQTELPFPVEKALCFYNQARFHPLKFLSVMADGVQVYEHSKVKYVKNHLVSTGNAIVRAEHIVFACHYPFINVPGYYFLRMHQERNYAMALAQTAGGNRSTLEGMYLGIDPESYSLRSTGDYLLIGGGNHRTGEHPCVSQYEYLHKLKEQYWPEHQEVACWSAQDCMTLDSIPYIGRYSGATRDLYVTAGFNKWGMSGSMAGAMILTDMITGVRRSPYAEVFSPQRGMLKPQLAINGVTAVKNLLTPSVKRCPHMGCALKWNRLERSWDCPCHGSRFEKNGRLIDNPATGGLK